MIEGVTTSVNINIPTLLAVLTIGSVIGTWVWKLSGKMQDLNSKIDLQQALFTQQLSEQQKHYDAKMGGVDKELAHLLEIINLRLKISDDKDKQILDSLTLQTADLKAISATVMDLKTVAAINQAVEKVRKETGGRG